MEQKITELAALHDDYDLFLLDQYGVLHNGYSPYPGAVETVNELRQAGKAVAILSNSGKRSHTNEARLEALGFSRELYDHFVTSGELACHLLTAAEEPALLKKREKSCYLIERGQNTSSHSPLNALNLIRTDNPVKANVILISGSEGDKYDERYYRDLLEPAAERGIVALCTNPDMVMLTQFGIHFGAGRIAEIYQELGGRVHFFGKPYPEIYQFALSFFPDVDPGRVLCVGDSLEHDIVGAHNVGLAGLLAKWGILANKSHWQMRALYEMYEAMPDYVMDQFNPDSKSQKHY